MQPQFCNRYSYRTAPSARDMVTQGLMIQVGWLATHHAWPCSHSDMHTLSLFYILYQYELNPCISLDSMLVGCPVYNLIVDGSSIHYDNGQYWLSPGRGVLEGKYGICFRAESIISFIIAASHPRAVAQCNCLKISLS